MYLLRNRDADPVYWVNDFLSDDEIKKIMNHVNNLPAGYGGVGDRGYVPKERITSVKWIEKNSKISWLYEKLIDMIKKVNIDNFDMTLKSLELLQFSEYNQKQKSFYKPHFDCVDSGRIMSAVDIRKLSFSIQLTDEKEYEGGELIIYKFGKELIAPKSKGTIIFFESNLCHEVTPVTKGVRHSLVGWVVGPNIR